VRERSPSFSRMLLTCVRAVRSVMPSAALARGERLRDLSVTRPTLEDVYLELTAEVAEEAQIDG
jgi:hypothetical protein